jgi:hypothetical protein
MLSGIKLSRTSFKIGRKTPPRPGSASTAPECALSDEPPVTKHSRPEWPSSASIVISPMSVLPPVQLAPSSREDIDMLQELGDAFHNPEVLDVRRQVNMFGMVRGFILRELRVSAR